MRAAPSPSLGSVTGAGRKYAARKTCEAIQWPGCSVTGVAVHYHGLGGDGTRLSVPEVRQVQGHDVSDSSDADKDEIDPFAGFEFGKAPQVENLGELKPIQSLESQHAHNANLVKQFEQLSQGFKAWRPVRGDGNCYYRAVLFAWLERSVALNRIDDLKNFDANVQRLKREPMLTASVRICHRALKKWAGRRSQCSSDTEVRTLLLEVSEEFNKVRSDQAFIQCLRHLVAEYMRQHAHEPSGQGDSAKGEVLTYEAWACALSSAEDNIRNIDDFCNRKVLMMNEDAADLVQPVCPKVLGTVVRICTVDRDSSRDPLYIDYGEGPLPSGTVRSAAQLANTNLGGPEPQIFLLLKPGHYDILIPLDGVGKLLEPERSLGALGERAPDGRRSMSGGAASGAVAQNDLQRKMCDNIWKGFVRLTHELVQDFVTAIRLLDEKIVEELTAKRKRLGSFDDSIFEGQLGSILDPLREKLRKFQCVPPDSPFNDEQELREAPSIQSLLPKLTEFHSSARSPSGGQAPPSAVRAVPVAVEVQAVAPKSKAKAQPPPTGPGSECCICIQPGAEVKAPCGCMYHPGCLGEYVSMEGKQPEEVRCHLHNHLMGRDFVLRHVPGLEQRPAPTAASPSVGSTFAQPAPTQPRLDALSQAPAIGLKTQRELSAFLAAESGVLGAAPPNGPSGLSGPRAAPVMVRPGVPDTGPLGGANPSLDSAAFLQPPATGLIHSRPPDTDVVVEASLPPEYCQLSQRQLPRTGQLPLTGKLPRTAKKLPATGNLGASFGIPCALCFGEEGVLKTLHCGAKAHPACLKGYWSQRVRTLHRLHNIDCPAAEVAGCTNCLVEGDLLGVVERADLDEANKHIQNVDEQNLQLIQQLKAQQEEYRPMFTCAICLTEHEVEGCCTLPCQHRFCFESLQYHFDIIVRERRLNKLTCPADGCDFNLRNEEHIHIFQQCLSDESYHKLLEFLTRDISHVVECRHRGCEERVFLDDEDDFANLQCPRGHLFCARCEYGPHRGMSCDERQEQMARQKKAEEDQKDQDAAWHGAMDLGWKPCPMRCTFGGGFKASEECDHVTCQCGFEFCWDCGVCRKVALVHDNRWHKPSCQYHTKPEEVAEKPRWNAHCPECAKLPEGQVCAFPPDDGYPQSYMSNRKSSRARVQHF
mmetsp:Transcript_88522/g.166945  ORF Transcript_88522/g.166945 Transcript_88522/m.166945 type:complete len:1154 (+) Transcript_88522:43-3504(+)